MQDGDYQSSKTSPDWLLPGFRISLSAKLRQEVLGFSCPQVVPVLDRSFEKVKIKKKRYKRGIKTDLLARTVHPSYIFDETEQSFFLFGMATTA